MTRNLSILSGLFAAFLTAAAVAQPPAPAPAVDLTPAFRSAAAGIANLRVYEVGGIVLIRGTATDRASAEQLGTFATSLGYTRVANLVQVVAAPDDAVIRRAVERTLMQHRSLDGSKLRVDSQGGIVTVAGTVAADNQKDEVLALLRTVDGVRDVRLDLQR